MVVDEEMVKKHINEKVQEIELDIKSIKAEAVKEFAEELKDRTHFITMNIEEFECCIDGLLKEMGGDDE